MGNRGWAIQFKDQTKATREHGPELAKR